MSCFYIKKVSLKKKKMCEEIEKKGLEKVREKENV